MEKIDKMKCIFCNMRDINQLVHNVLDHMSKGHAVTVTHWFSYHISQFEVLCEGELVSPFLQDVLYIYPCGTFECSRCHSIEPLSANHTHNAYYDMDGPHTLMCEECALHQPLGSSCPALFVATEGPVVIGATDWHLYEDHRPECAQKYAEQLDGHKEICRHMAEVNGMFYLDGKNMADLRRERLSRRVLRRWRAFVQRRFTTRMYHVLLLKADVGQDAAMSLAIRHTTQGRISVTS